MASLFYLFTHFLYTYIFPTCNLWPAICLSVYIPDNLCLNSCLIFPLDLSFGGSVLLQPGWAGSLDLLQNPQPDFPLCSLLLKTVSEPLCLPLSLFTPLTCWSTSISGFLWKDTLQVLFFSPYLYLSFTHEHHLGWQQNSRLCIIFSQNFEGDSPVSSIQCCF